MQVRLGLASAHTVPLASAHDSRPHVPRVLPGPALPATCPQDVVVTPIAPPRESRPVIIRTLPANVARGWTDVRRYPGASGETDRRASSENESPGTLSDGPADIPAPASARPPTSQARPQSEGPLNKEQVRFPSHCVCFRCLLCSKVNSLFCSFMV